jgi:hypothetical protein
MTTESATAKKRALPNLLLWLERFLIALCGVLIGAVGSGKFGASQIGVTVAIPGSVDQPPSSKVCISQPAAGCRKTVIGIATFSNGGSALSDAARQNTQLWAQALARCDGVDLRLVGTTSSLPYRTGFSKSNVWLAAERANSVAAIFHNAGLKSIDIQESTHEAELDALRFVNDRRDRKTDPLLAAVARRVDLDIRSLGSCEPDKQ